MEFVKSGKNGKNNEAGKRGINGVIYGRYCQNDDRRVSGERTLICRNDRSGSVWL